MDLRRVRRMLTVVIVGMVVFALSPMNARSAEEGRKAWPKEFIIGSPSLGSSYYVCNVGLGTLIQKNLNLQVHVEVTGGVDPATKMMIRKEIHLNAGSNASVLQAYKGTGKFEKDGKQPLRMLCNAYALTLATWVRADSNIKTIKDLKGKRWMIDKTGAVAVDIYRETMIKFHGLERNDIKLQPIVGVEGAIDNMRDRLTDAWTWPTSFGPAPELVDLSQSIPLSIIPLSDPEMKALIEASSGYYPSFIKGGLFKGIEKDMPTVGLGIVFYCMESMPADLVYAILDVIYGKTNQEFVSVHPTAFSMTIDHALDTIPVPLHDGAVKYYKDRNLWNNEIARKQESLIQNQ